MMDNEKLPEYSDIEKAVQRIKGHAIKTPLMESELLNQQLGGRLLIKPEVLQRTGSFKYRGAVNKISAILEEGKPSGVIAFSSGNHAQAVASTARQFGIEATIVMPEDAPKIKIENTKQYGANIVFYNRYTDDREQITAQLAEENQLTLIRPYDDPYIITGQGTIGYEIALQTQEMDVHSYDVAVCCGGGGLIAGIALAIKEHYPESNIWAVEPENFNDTMRSLEVGVRLSNTTTAPSICDSILTPIPGELTFKINSSLLAGAVGVSDDDVKMAMVSAYQYFKLVVEPGGAAALAAILSGKISIRNKTIVAILSGGNADRELYAKILAEAE
jgi:threonine dehydratase